MTDAARVHSHRCLDGTGLPLLRADPVAVARRTARKVSLAVTGLVSVHDHTWTTDRRRAATRWGVIRPELAEALHVLVGWREAPHTVSAEALSEMLAGPVVSVMQAFDQSIGMWPSSL